MAKIIDMQEYLAERRLEENEHDIAGLMYDFAYLIRCDFPSDTKKELVETAKDMLDDYKMKTATEGAFGR